MRLENLTAVTILIMFFWVWAPSGLAGRSQRFGEASVSIFSSVVTMNQPTDEKAN
jgi:hypothetical protein